MVFIYPKATPPRILALHKYSANWVAEWSLDLNDLDRGEEVAQLVVVDTIIWLFTQRIWNQQLKLFAYKVTLSGRVLARAQEVLSFPLSSKRHIRVTYTPDRQWACLSFSVRRLTDSLVHFGYFVIGRDSAFGGIWTPPYPKRKLEILPPLQPGYDGTLYALGKVEGRDALHPTYVLFRYIPWANLTLQLPLETDEGYLKHPVFRVEKEKIRLAGFYSERQGKGVRGLVFAEVRLPGFFLTVTQKTPLPQDILERYLSGRQIERGRGVPDLYLDHLIPQQDGGVILVGEQFFMIKKITRKSTMTQGQLPNTTPINWEEEDLEYHYYDVLIFSVDSLGALRWVRVIPKKQIGDEGTRAVLSYALLVGPTKLYIFYRGYESRTGVELFAVSVDKQGNMSSPSPLIPDFRAYTLFFRRYTRQLTSTEGLIIYYRSRTLKYYLNRVKLE